MSAPGRPGVSRNTWGYRVSAGVAAGPDLPPRCCLDGHGRSWPRLEVRPGHPGDGWSRRATATVAWVHPDPPRDVALVRIEGEPFTGGEPLVRWGQFVGPDPVPYTGLGYPEFADYESGRGVEQHVGMLPPLGVGADGGFVLDQDPAPEVEAGRAWPGVSGAAVFCKGLLTAVVTMDDRAFGNGRLHAVPAHLVTADPRFRPPHHRRHRHSPGAGGGGTGRVPATASDPGSWPALPGRCWPPRWKQWSSLAGESEIAQLAAWRAQR